MIDHSLSVAAPGWTVSSQAGFSAVLRCERRGEALEVIVRRCIDGPLRNAYPVSTHDVELSATNCTEPHCFSDELAELAHAILKADSHCRRVVFAAAADDQHTITALQAAGFRYVVDVDVPGAEASLLVAEPDWVRRVDPDLDRVPGT